MFLRIGCEIYDLINKKGDIEFFMTDITQGYVENATALFGQDIHVKRMEGVHG